MSSNVFLHKIASPAKNGISLSLYVQPGASKDEFCAVHNGRLKVRIAAKAADDAANEALLRFLSKTFAVMRSSISLVKGHKSRTKVVFIQGDPGSLTKSVELILETDIGAAK